MELRCNTWHKTLMSWHCSFKNVEKTTIFINEYLEDSNFFHIIIEIPYFIF